MAAQLWQEIGDAKPTQGLTMAALLDLPEALRTFLGWMVRQRDVPLTEVCDYLGQTPDVCRQQLLALQEKGLVRPVDRGGELHYQVWLVLERRRSNPLDVWRALEE